MLAQLTNQLFFILLDRPVIDRTGIKGRFDINIEFARPEGTPVWSPIGAPSSPPAPPADSDEPAGPSIFSVVEKQLGLKLDPS